MERQIGCQVVRRRTLRRRQRAALIKDLEADLDNIDAKLEVAIAKQEVLILEKMREILYYTYCKAIDSEV